MSAGSRAIAMLGYPVVAHWATRSFGGPLRVVGYHDVPALPPFASTCATSPKTVAWYPGLTMTRYRITSTPIAGRTASSLTPLFHRV